MSITVLVSWGILRIILSHKHTHTQYLRLLPWNKKFSICLCSLPILSPPPLPLEHFVYYFLIYKFVLQISTLISVLKINRHWERKRKWCPRPPLSFSPIAFLHTHPCPAPSQDYAFIEKKCLQAKARKKKKKKLMSKNSFLARTAVLYPNEAASVEPQEVILWPKRTRTTTTTKNQNKDKSTDSFFFLLSLWLH